MTDHGYRVFIEFTNQPKHRKQEEQQGALTAWTQEKSLLCQAQVDNVFNSVFIHEMSFDLSVQNMDVLIQFTNQPKHRKQQEQQQTLTAWIQEESLL